MNPCVGLLQDADFWRAVAIGAAAGAAAGLASALLPALLPVASLGFWGTVGVGALSGAMGGAAGQLTYNALTGVSLMDNVGPAALSGAVAGAAFSAVGYGLGRLAGLIGNGRLQSVDPRDIHAGEAKAPQPMRPNRNPLPPPGSAQWRDMGTNKVGTRFWGPDRVVYTGNQDVINAMNQRGSGIIIDGGHGFPTGRFRSDVRFFPDTVRFFNNPFNPYSGQVTVMDMNQLSRVDIQNLGGPGQNAYVNWCWGGFCRKILYALAAP
jgi:hypothetical protein